MPELVRGLPLPLGAPVQDLKRLAADKLGIPLDQVAEVRPRKVSLDARGKRPKRVYTVELWRSGEDVPPDRLPERPAAKRPRKLVVGEAPVVVGTGPAGLWAAIRFVDLGQPVILLERGGALETRNRAVVGLRRHGELDPESNLCFGEGGAGTYSDGKLYTRISDGRVRDVYRDLVAFGAQPQILTDAHPHIGTNRLVRVLQNLRAWLVAAGCELRFDARVEDLLTTSDGAVAGVRLADGAEIPSPAVVLATGHSSRDIYELLARAGASLERKAFAVGARLEHPQALIDEIQYGRFAGHPELDAATYALKAQVGGRGVYSFCMCPGGFVIPTTTEPGRLNVNGMSSSNRGSRYANSAIVVTVEPEDFYLDRPGDLDALGALAGVALQRHLEALAFEAGGGGYRAPAQRLSDFLDGRAGDLPQRTSYRPGLTPADLHAVLPRRVTSAMARGCLSFDRKMNGFVTADAVLIGVETTTSSPVRVRRDAQTLAAEGLPGLYPCGEGAGYSGGIVSSAIDGIKVADAVVSTARLRARSAHSP